MVLCLVSDNNIMDCMSDSKSLKRLQISLSRISNFLDGSFFHWISQGFLRQRWHGHFNSISRPGLELDLIGCSENTNRTKQRAIAKLRFSDWIYNKHFLSISKIIAYSGYNNYFGVTFLPIPFFLYILRKHWNLNFSLLVPPVIFDCY